jgi:hypothetical protein
MYKVTDVMGREFSIELSWINGLAEASNVGNEESLFVSFQDPSDFFGGGFIVAGQACRDLTNTYSKFLKSQPPSVELKTVPTLSFRTLTLEVQE